MVAQLPLKDDNSQQLSTSPGTIVRCRQRQWVVLPSPSSEIIRLRPLSGLEEESCGIYLPLERELEPADFPLPSANTLQDLKAAQLLLDAARLSLRSGAGPFRCLGRLSVRPRPYQLVPLLMALRLEIVRLLISDDVGIGKSIEAGLIAREMLDRGEIKRICVLCPPQLCDQWQRELKQKFHIDAVVIRSGTAAKLERGLPSVDSHIFSYYPHIIVSLDYAKSERRRASFLTHCPDFVIVDEVHTCSESTPKQQQRYQLVKQISQKNGQHLVLLTATPHSGIEASFRSILGLLKPEFAQLDLNHLTEAQRIELARHFVQRRRIDVKDWLGNSTPFPKREAIESPYPLSETYRELFEQVYDFARGLVKSVDESLSYAQKRGRYWSALAIIRCVMSSPAAAIATLSRQVSKDTGDLEEWDEDLAANYVLDTTEGEQITDNSPFTVVERGQKTYRDIDKRKLREFVKIAEQLRGKEDTKLQKAIALIKDLLKEGLHPIIWCRYIATANYVAETLRNDLEGKKNTSVRVISITGELSEDEREIRLQELQQYPQRVMIATDCLSEGINLQEHFTACIHYDLPFNPNRLEQREGRIDRYGQTVEKVKCILLYGQDNPVDGAVLEVLIRKAVTIHRTLGITVPVPMDSNTVQEAVFKSLFERATDVRQLSLFDLTQDDTLAQVHNSWDRVVEREKQNRTRFAQRSIKPDEVERELLLTDLILGNEADVERFVLTACDRLGTSLVRKKQGWDLSQIPRCVQYQLGDKPRLISFTTPTPEGIEYVGRNHSLVEGLARHLFEEALENIDTPTAARCGVTVTDAVAKPTFILLLRLRHLLENRKQGILAEECLIQSFTGLPNHPQWLSDDQTLSLLATVQPTGDLSQENKRSRIEMILGRMEQLQPHLEKIANKRAEALSESHQRVRAMTKEGKVTVIPQLPMDVLGVYCLIPQ
ncbi:helicase [Aphanothece hegewaldii CCALA 016]|uniref:Helicase n=1 Tax=Aphanothece hegewaldii CCALA 016 TaxID=2107694 RepID=A0A2T1LSY6_9CHRO|nr:helicase-related protein [Aphanothece hegewaldii]PSF33320.1 helicase [Aphanothece hegewaldii CCALA 016]